ncbi:MAG: hypothetical protein IJX88_02890 [Clostridia bacterium]|nr:hypothetical protein [Clostridia bacterium]
MAKMDIAEIDKNFKLECVTDPDVIWYDIEEENPLTVYGIKRDGEMFTRMPFEIASTVNFGVQYSSRDTAGGRIRFKTDAPYIAIKCILTNGGPVPNMPFAGSHGVGVYCNDYFAGVAIPNPTSFIKCEEDAFVYDRAIRVPQKMQSKLNTVTVCTPLYCGVHKLYIGLKKGSTVLPPDPYKYEKPVVFYGSSITQGGCASHPGNEYTALLSRWLNTDYINLGYSGAARGEQTMAAYIASLDASVYVIDYDHNAANAEHLQNTHYPFYETIRKANPATPIVFMTKPDYDYDPDAHKRRAIIKATYEKALASGDNNVRFIDGKHFYGKTNRDGYAVDSCHPTDFGFYRMAKKVLPVLKELLEKQQ